MQYANRFVGGLLFVALVLTGGLFWAGESVAGGSWPPSDQWLEEHEDDDDSDTVDIRCPSRSKCLPPGTCTQRSLDSLQRDKDRACNRSRSCSNFRVRAPKDPNDVQTREKVDCDEISKRIDYGKACREARTEVMSECFRGGDGPHVRERENVQEVIDDCKEKFRSAESMGICE